MKLNHMDLPVADVAGVKEFFITHFGFRLVSERDDGLTVLVDEAQFVLTLTVLLEDEKTPYPSGFHLGFNLATEAELRDVHDRLTAAGADIVRPLGMLGAALCFHCLAPGAVLIELAWRPH